MNFKISIIVDFRPRWKCRYTLHLLTQPKEEQQIQEQKITTTARNSNCLEVRQPRRERRNIHPDESEGRRGAAREERTHGKVEAGGLGGPGTSWWSRWSHICVQITGEHDRPLNPGFHSRGNKDSQPWTEKTCSG